MELIYSSNKLERTCKSLREARKFFGGNTVLANCLLYRINSLEQADALKDIILQPQFRFHKLKNKNGKNLEGYFGIDVKTKKEAWRIILQPLDENNNPYVPCNIDEIAGKVKIVGIKEVSKHYE